MPRLPLTLSLATALAAVVVVVVAPSARAAVRALPVPGPVVRPFTYARGAPFAGGAHRGADLAAAPGARVRAACGGVVVNTRGVGARAVTLRCGPWRVTELPLASVAVRVGTRVRPGAVLGTLAASRQHAGLHLGVRRAGDGFGYVDPVSFLRRGRRRVVPPAVIPRLGPRAAPPAGAPPVTAS